MNNKTAGIIAIICSPFLYIDFLVVEQNTRTWQTGLLGLIYMTGWICSILAMRRMKVLGRTKFARVAYSVQLVLLACAQAWNIWVIAGPSDSILFTVLDMCWPLSNLWMLVLGITAFRAKQLTGWKRYVPLFVGLWFPLCVVPAITMGYFILAGPYSALAFALLGYVVYKGEEEESLKTAVMLA